MQQSAMPISASSSMSVRSLGRFNTHTLSSLSTARPVTPPSFHLFGRVFGQSGSNLNFGAVSVCAPSTAQKQITAKPGNATATLFLFRFMRTPSSRIFDSQRRALIFLGEALVGRFDELVRAPVRSGPVER